MIAKVKNTASCETHGKKGRRDPGGAHLHEPRAVAIARTQLVEGVQDLRGPHAVLLAPQGDLGASLRALRVPFSPLQMGFGMF